MCKEGCGCVAKIDSTVVDGDLLQKSLTALRDTMTAAMDAQRKEFEGRLAAISAQPAPPKGVVSALVVTKSADADGTTMPDNAFDDFQKAVLAGDNDAMAREQIKLIHKFAPRRLA